MHDEAKQPTEEELQAALEEQMRNVRVEDIVLQTAATLINLAARRLGLTPEAGEDELDLEQARTAIEAVRALVPLCPPDQAEAVREALSQVQMAYAKTARGGDAAAKPPVAGAQPEEQPDDAARAEVRSRIWTPPGS